MGNITEVSLPILYFVLLQDIIIKASYLIRRNKLTMCLTFHNTCEKGLVQDLQAVNRAVVPRASTVPDPHTL